MDLNWCFILINLELYFLNAHLAMFLIWQMDTTAKGAKKNTSLNVIHLQYAWSIHLRVYCELLVCHVMFQAIAALHEENATYPKKITYAYTAHTSPRLAVEALEASGFLCWWCKIYINLHEHVGTQLLYKHMNLCLKCFKSLISFFSFLAFITPMQNIIGNGSRVHVYFCFYRCFIASTSPSWSCC